MKVLVLGSAGQVGRAVVQAARRGCELVTLSRAELDIGDEKAVAHAVAKIGPQWIVNAAAYTAVDLAEDERAQAQAVNDTAVGTLATAAELVGSRLLHLSTDFVFDGEANCAYLPTDQPNPISVYGATKFAGERHVLRKGTGIVLRTAWVYASTGRNFVLTMLRLMRERDQVRVVCDQIGTPTWATGLARAIWGIMERAPASGIYHWTDLGVASWYDFAMAIQEEALAQGLLSRTVPIVPISSSDYPTSARRPAFSVLNTDATRAVLKQPGHHWRYHLRMMLDELQCD